MSTYQDTTFKTHCLRTAMGLLTAASLLTCAGSASAAPPAGSLQILNVVGFEGAYNLPVWVAQQKGLFTANGLAVNLSFPKGSAQVVGDLDNGSAQLSMMSVDNVLAYDGTSAGQMATPNLPAANNLVVFMGGDHGFLSLVAQHGITSVDQLRGRVLSVDAMDTGFAFALFNTLAKHDLNPTNTHIIPIGGTGFRYRELVAGKQDATLLRPPFEMLSEEKGLNILLPSSQLEPIYLGTIGAVRKPWADAHQAEMTAFINSYHEALLWIFDKANEPGALAILHSEYPSLSPTYLVRTYDLLTNSKTGLIEDMGIDRPGLARVKYLRNKYAPGSSDTKADADMIDLQFLAAAHNSPAWAGVPKS
jgi:ABC-type nitrate/sulfonate/bicarbonate transport system substrate-binding protein